MNRPTHKELYGKLRSARKAVEDGRIAMLNQFALAADAIVLDYSIDSEKNHENTQLPQRPRPYETHGR